MRNVEIFKYYIYIFFFSLNVCFISSYIYFNVLVDNNSPALHWARNIHALQRKICLLTHGFTAVTGHIQIAQVPDRHEPDSDGELSYTYLFKLLEELDYQDYIGCEYKPQRESGSLDTCFYAVFNIWILTIAFTAWDASIRIYCMLTSPWMKIEIMLHKNILKIFCESKSHLLIDMLHFQTVATATVQQLFNNS